MSKSWKESLISSGLPLEFELVKRLEAKGCLADFEYSYFRLNETNIERQFSYDVDAAYIREELLREIEAKRQATEKRLDEWFKSMNIPPPKRKRKTNKN